MKSVDFNGTIIIGDPCEMVASEEDWQKCNWGKHMEKIGINHFLYVDYEEDCPTVVSDTGAKLGSFCTDSCAIVVMYLEDLIKYNPAFNQHIEYPENWTIMQDFVGKVTIKIIKGDKHIIGIGNVSFNTVFED